MEETREASSDEEKKITHTAEDNSSTTEHEPSEDTNTEEPRKSFRDLVRSACASPFSHARAQSVSQSSSDSVIIKTGGLNLMRRNDSF